MQMAVPDRAAELSESVVILMQNAMLSMDLSAALDEAGLHGQMGYRSRGLAKAIIVDLDDLDRRGAAAIRLHRRAKVPIIAIAYDHETAARIAGRNAIWVSKPVVSNAVAETLQGIFAKSA